MQYAEQVLFLGYSTQGIHLTIVAGLLVAYLGLVNFASLNVSFSLMSPLAAS